MSLIQRCPYHFQGCPLRGGLHCTCLSDRQSHNAASQIPKKSVHLQGNTSRYGCSEGIVKPACGVVPTLHPDSIAVLAPSHRETWYNTEFVGTGADTRPPVPTNLPPIVLKPQVTRPGQERTGKTGIRNTTDSMPGSGASVRPKRAKRRMQFLKQPPTWLSEWTGPM